MGGTRKLLVGDRPQLLLSDAAWVAINVTALAATVIVLAVGAGIAGYQLRRSGRSVRVLGARFGHPLGIVAFFTMAVVGGLLLFSVSRPVFDGYFWPLAPPLAILLLYVPKDLLQGAAVRRQTNLILGGCAAGMATVLAALSLVCMMNSHSFAAARWRAGEQLVFRPAFALIRSTRDTNGWDTTQHPKAIQLNQGAVGPSTELVAHVIQCGLMTSKAPNSRRRRAHRSDHLQPQPRRWAHRNAVPLSMRERRLRLARLRRAAILNATTAMTW